MIGMINEKHWVAYRLRSIGVEVGRERVQSQGSPLQNHGFGYR